MFKKVSQWMKRQLYSCKSSTFNNFLPWQVCYSCPSMFSWQVDLCARFTVILVTFAPSNQQGLFEIRMGQLWIGTCSPSEIKLRHAWSLRGKSRSAIEPTYLPSESYLWQKAVHPVSVHHIKHRTFCLPIQFFWSMFVKFLTMQFLLTTGAQVGQKVKKKK